MTLLEHSYIVYCKEMPSKQLLAFKESITKYGLHIESHDEVVAITKFETVIINRFVENGYPKKSVFMVTIFIYTSITSLVRLLFTL